MGTDDGSRTRTGAFHCNPLCPRPVGSSYLLWGHVDTSFPLQGLVGPDWACMCVTYCLILGGTASVCRWILPGSRLGELGYAAELGLCAATCCCYTKAACSDPGIVFKEMYDLHDMDEEFGGVEGGDKVPRNRCMHCDVIRGPNAQHCYDCDLCIRGLDHHCPWTGKCIGERTLWNFHMFLGSLCGLIIFSVVCVFAFLSAPVDE